MGNERDAVEAWDSLNARREKAVSEAINTIKENSTDLFGCIVHITSMLSDVNEEDIFSVMRQRSDILYARWFVWYAYRYATAETYSSIAHIMERYGDFNKDVICGAVIKMGKVLESNNRWHKRWVIVKKIIDEYKAQGMEQSEKDTVTLTIRHAAHVNIEIKHEII